MQTTMVSKFRNGWLSSVYARNLFLRLNRNLLFTEDAVVRTETYVLYVSLFMLYDVVVVQ